MTTLADLAGSPSVGGIRNDVQPTTHVGINQRVLPNSGDQLLHHWRRQQRQLHRAPGKLGGTRPVHKWPAMQGRDHQPRDRRYRGHNHAVPELAVGLRITDRDAE